jgi:hypothetical protein
VYSPLQNTNRSINNAKQTLHNEAGLFSMLNLYFWKKNPTQKNGNRKLVPAKLPKGTMHRTRHEIRQARDSFLIIFRNRYVTK